MKAAPLLVAWHDDNTPVYSAHFELHGRSRLATGGGDGNVRLWKVDTNGETRKVTYLSTLKRHSQAVNVVRWCPKGELLASAGDDGNVLLWAPSDNPALHTTFGEDTSEDLEHWRVKTMCRSSTGSEIYDLAWSPDGLHFVTGSMDNVARIYNASTGTPVRQIAEHNHYVQGVAWDPLGEFLATQSSDRSVHVYALKTKDGQFSLDQYNKITKMDLPSRRISSNSPAPPDFGNYRSVLAEPISEAIGSPRPSAPGTPQSLALPMNPPPTTHSRRSSFSSQVGHSIRRSVSPSPSLMPLPAVMPSASPSLAGSISMGVRNTNIYANETFTSFFRRLTFAPDGSLLFTPAGQFKMSNSVRDGAKPSDDIINTVYIYTRAGLNKPAVAYLPGHKKPSIAVKCSPVYYHLRSAETETKEITIDTRTEEDIPQLPEPAVLPTKASTSFSTMDPPPLMNAPSPAPSATAMASPRPLAALEPEQSPSTPSIPAGPAPAFGLPYRIVYAVATQDAVHLYDTQQQKPLCVVNNLHYATFTDLTWSADGNTLLMTSSDGFCSVLTFAPGELGTIYHVPAASRHTPAPISVGKANSTTSTPQATPTPTTATAGFQVPPAIATGVPRKPSLTSGAAPPQSPTASFASMVRPASPARSMSISSVGTEAGYARAPDQNATPVMNNPTPSMSALPSVAAAGSLPANAGGIPLFTPPQTPAYQANGSATNSSHVGGAGIKRSSNASESGAESAAAGAKREVDTSDTTFEETGREKRRRIAPTLVAENEFVAPAPPSTTIPPKPHN